MAMRPAETEAPTTQAGMQVASRVAHPRLHSSSPRRQLTPPPPPLQVQLVRMPPGLPQPPLHAPVAAAAALMKASCLIVLAVQYGCCLQAMQE